MAAAEARTAWQRMANRCVVQEDAKRAPKFACSASKLQGDSDNGDATNEKDHHALNFAHLNWNPTNSNLPSDTKWWLQVRPNMGYKESTREQLHPSEGKLEEAKIIPSSKPEANADLGSDKNAGTVLEPPRIVSTKLARHNAETKIEGLKTETSNPEFLKYKLNLHENWYECDELMDWKAADQLISGEKDSGCFDLASPWTNGEKTEPWWKIADKEELVSFVAKKSREHFDNCDLPQPQKMHTCRGAFPCFENFEDDGGMPSSFDNNLNAGICIQSKHTVHSSYRSVDRRHPSFGQVEDPLSNSNMLHSHDHASAAYIDDKKERIHSSADPCKAELLEALCHSQTRAREAEIAAQKAYNEKEHVLKLFFRQASHLFAYKQWLQMLQLEKLYLQLRIKEQEPSTRSPDLPWAAAKKDQFARNGCKDGQRKGKEQHPCGICGVLLAFAVGFSLASAGLLLGWTLGCWLPV